MNFFGHPVTLFPIFQLTSSLSLAWNYWAVHFGVTLLSSRMDKVALTREKLYLLDDLQVELHLLCSYLSSCKIIHLPCTVPFSILKPLFDSNVHSCLERIMQCSLSDTSWRQAFCLGGLGLRESAYSASPAFLGSCNSVCKLASILLSVDVNQPSFPNERDAATVVIHISEGPASHIRQNICLMTCLHPLAFRSNSFGSSATPLGHEQWLAQSYSLSQFGFIYT